MKTLSEMSKQIGLNSVMDLVKAFGEKSYDTVQFRWRNKPRMTELMYKGLLYEQIELQERVIVEPETITEIVAELEGLKDQIEGLKNGRN